MQVEVDLRAEESFDALPGFRADGLEAAAALADDDGLLAGTFDVEIDVDVPQRVVLAASFTRVHLLDLHGQRVGQFVSHSFEGGFTDELGDHLLFRLIREVAVGVERG